MFVLMRSPATGIGLWLAAGDVIKTGYVVFSVISAME